MQNKYKEIHNKEFTIFPLSNSPTLVPCSSLNKTQNKPKPNLKQLEHKNNKLSFQQKSKRTVIIAILSIQQILNQTQSHSQVNIL